jgi:hypothetical protein
VILFSTKAMAAMVLTRTLTEIVSMHNATAALARVISLTMEFAAAKHAASASGIPFAAKPHEYSQRSLVVLKARHSGAQMYRRDTLKGDKTCFGPFWLSC